MMKVLIDSNIIVSSILKKDSTPHQAYKKAVEPPFKGVICEQNVEEIRKAFSIKFPDKLPMFEQFINTAKSEVDINSIPPLSNSTEDIIRDIKDRPILRAAINDGVDIIITGDKDFLIIL